jgi:hypothetical protein
MNQPSYNTAITVSWGWSQDCALEYVLILLQQKAASFSFGLEVLCS